MTTERADAGVRIDPIHAGDNDAGAFSTYTQPGQNYGATPMWTLPLHSLPKAQLTPLNRLWLIVLRGYLILAVALVVVRVAQLALNQG
jgi:Mn2+/Fe2+ NRAMP family transporter